MWAWLQRWFGSNEPKADLTYEGGRLKVRSYNQAFVKQLRQQHPDLTEGRPDDEVIKIFTERENLEHEEPKLTIVHWGVEPDGRIRMELDWNQAFIKMLRDEHDITAENDEDAVNRYLNMIRPDSDIDPRELTREEIDAAFSDIDAELARELREAEASIQPKRPRRRKVVRKLP